MKRYTPIIYAKLMAITACLIICVSISGFIFYGIKYSIIYMPNNYSIRNCSKDIYTVVFWNDKNETWDSILYPTIESYKIIGELAIGISRIPKNSVIADHTPHEPEGYFLLNTKTGELKKGLTRQECAEMLTKNYSIAHFPELIQLINE